MIVVSVPFAFQIRSLQGLVELETELGRRTARGAQVKQLKSENLSPSTSKVLFLETPTTGTVLILLPEINDFLQIDN